jgi:TM2 domain-containing membrane protein YozV
MGMKVLVDGSCRYHCFLIRKGQQARNETAVSEPRLQWMKPGEIDRIFNKTGDVMRKGNTVDTHSTFMGYLLWVFGFTGAHRFYYGRPISGTIYFFTLGLLLIGWIVDLFLIPSMERTAALRFRAGRIDYSLAWILLTFLGFLGVHRMYMGKWITGILYMLTGGFFLIGYIYDFWTLNDQITVLNATNC